MLNRVIGATIVLAAAAGTAQGAFFSFLSDVDHTSWTFGGTGTSVRDGQDPFDPQLLVIDDDNGAQFPLAYQVEFDADFVLSGAQRFNVGGKVLYTYCLDGVFSFKTVQNDVLVTLLSVEVKNAVLTALGDGFGWNSTATIQGNDQGSSFVAYSWFGGDNAGYGLYNGTSVGPDDFGFTLTALNTGGAIGTPVDQDTLYPVLTAAWRSEGSFSGSAYFVPSPGAGALLALGGLGALRRRR